MQLSCLNVKAAGNASLVTTAGKALRFDNRQHAIANNMQLDLTACKMRTVQ